MVMKVYSPEFKADAVALYLSDPSHTLEGSAGTWGDITSLPVGDGEFCYLATVLDCFSRRVVGWSIADHMRTSPVAGRSLIVSGPEALTPADKVSAIAAATGREIRFTELTDDQARRQWRAEGWPEEGIEFMLHMWATVPETVARVTSAVEEVVGRPPRTFAQWAAAHADAFRP